MRVNILFAVLTLIMVIIVILMADSLITALIIVTLLLNFLAVGSYWKKIQHGFASINAVGWGQVPDDTADDSTEEPAENIEDTMSEIDFNLSQYRKSMIEENRIPAENTEDDQNTNLYGRAQEEYDSYNTAYTNCWRKPKPAIMRTCAEQDYSIDSANVMMAQRRARDKRCMDGFVSKDVNYYKFHFAGELDESESKVWWGRGDY